MRAEVIVIREAGAGDQEFIWEMLFWAAHADEQVGVTPDSIRSDPDLIRYGAGFGERPGDLGVIAALDGADCGAAWVRLFVGEEVATTSYVAPNVPELAIAVKPGLEGQGLGSLMLRTLIAHATGRFPNIVLTARLDNPAVRLYERHGFQEVGRITNRVGTESIKMVLGLQAGHAE